MQSNLYYFVAGEASGDLHGSALLKELKDLNPHICFKGVGGEKMQAEGLKALLPFEDFCVMGFSDIILALPKLTKHFYSLAKQILHDNPQTVVMIDYPGFNLRLAKYLRKQGFQGKLVQYISPTVWAWKKNRIYSMAKTLNLLLAIFPFEPACYKKTSLKAVYVGNPLIHTLQDSGEEKLNLPEIPLLALFPGSRFDEIKRNLPILLKSAELFRKKFPTFGIAISVAHPSFKSLIQKYSSSLNNVWLIEEKDRYALMKKASLALAKSGTVVLELALLGCPTVVAYKLSLFNYLLARYLFRIDLPYFSLPNILLNEPLCPEWYKVELSPQALADSLETVFHKKELFKTKQKELKTLLTHKNASQEAAKEILHV